MSIKQDMGTWTILEQAAFDYGHYVAMREVSAKSSTSLFYIHDEICRGLWNKLIDAGAYADEEHSILKDEYRPYYVAGFEGTVHS